MATGYGRQAEKQFKPWRVSGHMRRVKKASIALYMAVACGLSPVALLDLANDTGYHAALMIQILTNAAAVGLHCSITNDNETRFA